MPHNARAATVGTPRTAGEKRKAIAAQAGHDGGEGSMGGGGGKRFAKVYTLGYAVAVRRCSPASLSNIHPTEKD